MLNDFFCKDRVVLKTFILAIAMFPMKLLNFNQWHILSLPQGGYAVAVLDFEFL